MSLLLLSAVDGDLATIKRLLADGTADINERTRDGSSALTLAALEGHLSTVQWLLVAGGSRICEKNARGDTALINSVITGHLAVVQWLLTTGGASITDTTYSGFSTLFLAVAQGHTAMAQWFIKERGADVNKVTNGGLTAFTSCLAHGRHALAQWMLEEGGATINQDNDDGGISPWSALCAGPTQVADTADLAALLKVMVLLDDAPAYVIDTLSPAHAKIATRGRQLRAQLPSYLKRQRALVVAHCLLPSALQPIVAGYAAPTPEDMWAEGGLRVRAKRARAVVVAGASVPVLRRSLRLRQKRG
jgi:ankyrin repeat protein